MSPVLIVEDSPIFRNIGKKRIQTAFDAVIIWTRTLAETIKY